MHAQVIHTSSTCLLKLLHDHSCALNDTTIFMRAVLLYNIAKSLDCQHEFKQLWCVQIAIILIRHERSQYDMALTDLVVWYHCEHVTAFVKYAGVLHGDTGEFDRLLL